MIRSFFLESLSNFPDPAQCQILKSESKELKAINPFVLSAHGFNIFSANLSKLRSLNA